VELQFHENDTADKQEDCLVEMRLYLPEDNNDDNSDNNDDVPTAMYTSETFQQAVMDQANIRYRHTILYCSILCCTVLYCTVLCCTILYCVITALL
jgi:Structure-specific recognition protein (SSRP1)